MKKNLMELIDFLYELTDIQIKKYKGLTTIGVGPDAGVNADLVRSEVLELLLFISELQILLTNESVFAGDMRAIFLQVQFYVEQEYMRGRAAWLIDENNIHNAEFGRVGEQKEYLATLSKKFGFDDCCEKPPFSEVQAQVAHDTLEISHLILMVAATLKMNPSLAVEYDIPIHALTIMRKHARPGGRYHDATISAEIDSRLLITHDKLQLSPLQKSATILTKEVAQKYVEVDKKQLHELLKRYHSLNPQSRIFTEQHRWHKIGVLQKKPQAPTLADWLPSRSALFAVAASTFIVGASATVIYTRS